MLAPLSDKSLLQSWEARLQLSFRPAPHDVQRTQLFHQHRGPLRIQKALYPEGDAACHAILIHPPGGIAAGDDLGLTIDVQDQAHAVITTPGAAKWYGSQPVGDIKASARQQIDCDLEGHLEWLPQESIMFNHAVVHSAINVRAAAQSSMFGWDTLIFGRSESGESFDQGSFRQVLRVELDQQLAWKDQLVLQGKDALFQSPIGLRGFHALATCWAICPKHQPWQESDLSSLRKAQPHIAWTQLHARLIVGRSLGMPLDLRARLLDAWGVFRPRLFQRKAVPLRIWST